ncbi:MAG: PDZ domain-containing protein [Sphingomonadaceae bacterium]|nr:PDZ domain-containing protein [Sphingomonadaceae bacterium]
MALLFVAVFALVGNSAAADETAFPLEKSWPVQLRQQMLRLSEVEWRLRISAGPHCRANASATGLTLDYIGAYEPQDRALVRRELGLSNRPQIAAVADGSPADLAGIRPGDNVVAIDGTGVDMIFARSTNRKLLADEITDRLAQHPSGKPITLRIQRGRSVFEKKIWPTSLCASRVILVTDRSIEAYSNDRDMGITTAMVGFTHNDNELALIAGHEMAHLIHRHKKGASLPERRQMEDLADLTGAALAHCAGYDITTAAAFWPRYRKQDRWSWTRLPTHRSPAKREERIRKAIPTFTCPFSPPQSRASSQPK